MEGAKTGRPKGTKHALNSTLRLTPRAEREKKELMTKYSKPNQQPGEIEDAGDGQYLCVCCGKKYKLQERNFPSSNSQLFSGNGGYVPICRGCVDKLYLNFLDFFKGNEDLAIERCCQIFDWYYNPDAVKMTKKNPVGKTLISSYPNKTNMMQIRSKGTTYLDTMSQGFRANIDSIQDYEKHVTEATESGEQIVIDKNTIAFFGLGYTPEEYQFLSEQYADWSSRYECVSKVHEELFKSLSIQQLVIRRAQKHGSTRDVGEAMKTFQDLLGTANLKPNQNNLNTLEEQNTFGTLIRKWENERPIGKPEPEWEDVDGIRKYVGAYFFGHLCELLHIDNDYAEEYREELEKHTVKKPQYEENDDMVESNIFDKFSNKRESSKSLDGMLIPTEDLHPPGDET